MRSTKMFWSSLGPTIRKSKCISKGSIEKHVQVPCKFSLVYFVNQTKKKLHIGFVSLKQKSNDFPFVSGAATIKIIPPPHRAFPFLFWLFHFIIFHPSTSFCQAKTQTIPLRFGCSIHCCVRWKARLVQVGARGKGRFMFCFIYPNWMIGSRDQNL